MTQTLDEPRAATKPSRSNGENLPAIAPPRLPFHPAVEERFGVDRASWKALVEAIFPNAQSAESVILALSYCRARKLDPFKRNVHIVPIWDKNRRCLVDTIWPGIGELRTTAFRTGDYAGREQAEFGPDLAQRVGKTDLTFPEWAQVTVYRMVRGQRVAFAGPRVYWLETYAVRSRDDDSPNDMWATRTRGQIEKCAEAAALRAAFPEEIGSDQIADEVAHQTAKHVESTTVEPARGTAGLLNKLREQQPLPDTQLNDEDAAAELAKQTAAQEADQTHADTSGIGDEPPATSEPQTTPEDAEISIAEALSGSWDEVKSNLRAALEKSTGSHVSKADFNSGAAKFLASRKVIATAAATVPADLPKTQAKVVRELYDAIAAKTWDLKSGAVLNPNAD